MNDALPWNEDPLASGWKEHSQFHWSRVVNGKRLDYWPTKNKFQYDNVVQTGDVNEFIRNMEAKTTPVVEQEQPRVIDLTPTWGEIGRLFCNLASSNEQETLRHILPEAARAFALAGQLELGAGTLQFADSFQSQPGKPNCPKAFRQIFGHARDVPD